MQADQYLLFFFALLGGLGMVLVGLKFLSESFQVLSGRCIQWVLNAITKNLGVSVVAGALIAFLVQSGVTTTLMAVSFASSGLLSFGQLAAVMLGSNFGTLLTTWLFIADVGNLGLYFLGIGALPMLYARFEKVAYTGKFIFSIGLLLMGFHLLNEGMADPLVIRNMIEVVIPPTQHPMYIYITIMLVSLVASLAIRSSVAMVAVLMAMVASEVIPGVYGVIGVLGVNVGMALPVLWAVRHSTSVTRRGAAFHFLTQLIGLMVITIFFMGFWEFNFDFVTFIAPFFKLDLATMGDVAMIPVAHMFFNIVASILGAALYVPLKWLVHRFVRSASEKEMQRLQLLGRISHMSPSLALEQAFQEVKKLAAMVESILQLTNNVVTGTEDQEQEGLEKTIKYEAITDNIQDELIEFLSRTMEVPLSQRQGRQVKALMRMTDELESVADNCKYIVEHYHKLKEKNTNHTKELSDFVSEYFDEVLTYYEWVFTELADADPIESSEAEVKIRDYKAKSMDLKSQQLALLEKVNKKTKEADLARTMSDILVNLNQVRSHTLNIHQAFQYI